MTAPVHDGTPLTILPSRKITIAVGSTNRVKVQAVANNIDHETIQLISFAAESKVRPQPLSDEETLQGAINRAQNCLNQTSAERAIGLEAGVILSDGQIHLCHWGAIVDRNQRLYYTNGPLIQLPQEYLKPLLAGEDLESIMHRSMGIERLGMKEGAVGIFTQNRLTREELLTQVVKVLMGQYYFFSS